MSEHASNDIRTLGELGRQLDRIERDLTFVRDDHESRLRRAERWTYTLPPTIVTAAAAVIIALVRGGP
jgi:hypothetical protein